MLLLRVGGDVEAAAGPRGCRWWRRDAPRGAGCSGRCNGWRHGPQLAAEHCLRGRLRPAARETLQMGVALPHNGSGAVAK